MRRISLLLTVILSFWCSTVTQASVPANWKKTAFAYDAKHTTLRAALKEFSGTFGVKLSMGKVAGTLEGKIRADSAKAYLDRLALAYRFQWFVYNGTLYVSPLDDQTSLSLEVSEDAVPDLKEALTQVGLLDKRFGWGELPDEGVVIISGPRRYVRLIQKLAKKKKKGDEKLEIMVFPLKYAQANDRHIKYREQALVIPGVANMLNELLGHTKKTPLAQNAPDNSLTNTLQSFSSMQDSAQQRIRQQVSGQNVSRSQQAQAARERKSGNAMITADIRNNAVLIRDDTDKRSRYQTLINQLDQPRNVIEIDAIILDIDRSKLKELGFNWRIGSGSTEATMNASAVTPFIPDGSAATVLIQDFGHFFARIKALESDGDASLVANPSILTVENQPAVIDFNHTAFIKNTGERVANVTSLTAGTSLQVVPRLIDTPSARLIQLSLDIEDGDIKQTDAQSTPSIQKGTISTQAIVRTQRSLVIGGFKVEKNQQQQSKVPLLGDIPGVGKLFSYTSNSHSKRERLFIITPRLVGNEMNPLEYTSGYSRELLTKSIRQKKSAPPPVSRQQIKQAFTRLSHYYIPDGFTRKKAPVDPGYYCQQQEQLEFNRQKLQWYSHKDYAVLISVLHNDSNQPVRFDQARCNHRHMLAVTVRPDALLAPGESAEIMMAVRHPDLHQQTRKPLVHPAL
ncbi:type III secretion system outer membrane ring subunit SctC [Vibrio quintilis]|uniref:Type 3 secretion system secretin n=1 Tax=Vibrio quintilis TaxID=1117707 RepID=A0A1M7YSN7_9VIBR|nr:type III secretion system outer membrane ring subunit SctC [Vibrio quintilis]SHO55641.1 Type III secretion system outer membrane protein SpiA precursor [Vibrio quintilis]